jgi:dTDP-4-dehydrorhamnose reductase
MKVLVVGSNGMAGHVITKFLRKQGHTVSTVAKSNADYRLDVEETAGTQQFFEEIKNDYDFIINCIGLLVKDVMIALIEQLSSMHGSLTS